MLLPPPHVGNSSATHNVLSNSALFMHCPLPEMPFSPEVPWKTPACSPFQTRWLLPEGFSILPLAPGPELGKGRQGPHPTVHNWRRLLHMWVAPPSIWWSRCLGPHSKSWPCPVLLLPLCIMPLYKSTATPQQCLQMIPACYCCEGRDDALIISETPGACFLPKHWLWQSWNKILSWGINLSSGTVLCVGDSTMIPCP